jgi:hypothetical protein
VRPDDPPWWDDGQLMALVAEVLDDEEDDCAEVPTSAAQGDQSAGISLKDVVAAGQAAYCWLDVVITLRNVARHHGLAAGASTAHEPGH